MTANGAARSPVVHIVRALSLAWGTSHLSLWLLGLHWSAGEVAAAQRRLHGWVEAPVLSGHLAADAILTIAGFLCGLRILLGRGGKELSSTSVVHAGVLRATAHPAANATNGGLLSVRRQITLQVAVQQFFVYMIKSLLPLYGVYAAGVVMSCAVMSWASAAQAESAGRPASQPATVGGIGQFLAPTARSITRSLLLLSPSDHFEDQPCPWLWSIALVIRYRLMAVVGAAVSVMASRLASVSSLVCAACSANEPCVQEYTPLPLPAARGSRVHRSALGGANVGVAVEACRSCAVSKLPRWADGLVRRLFATFCSMPDVCFNFLVTTMLCLSLVWRIAYAPVLVQNAIRYSPNNIRNPWFDWYATHPWAHAPSFCAGLLASRLAIRMNTGAATFIMGRFVWFTSIILVLLLYGYDITFWYPLLPSVPGPLVAPSSFLMPTWQGIQSNPSSLIRPVVVGLYQPAFAAALGVVLAYSYRSQTLNTWLRGGTNPGTDGGATVSGTANRGRLASFLAASMQRLLFIITSAWVALGPYLLTAWILFAPVGYMLLFYVVKPPSSASPGLITTVTVEVGAVALVCAWGVNRLAGRLAEVIVANLFVGLCGCTAHRLRTASKRVSAALARQDGAVAERCPRRVHFVVTRLIAVTTAVVEGMVDAIVGSTTDGAVSHSYSSSSADATRAGDLDSASDFDAAAAVATAAADAVNREFAYRDAWILGDDWEDKLMAMQVEKWWRQQRSRLHQQQQQRATLASLANGADKATSMPTISGASPSTFVEVEVTAMAAASAGAATANLSDDDGDDTKDSSENGTSVVYGADENVADEDEKRARRVARYIVMRVQREMREALSDHANRGAPIGGTTGTIGGDDSAAAGASSSSLLGIVGSQLRMRRSAETATASSGGTPITVTGSSSAGDGADGADGDGGGGGTARLLLPPSLVARLRLPSAQPDPFERSLHIVTAASSMVLSSTRCMGRCGYNTLCCLRSICRTRADRLADDDDDEGGGGGVSTRTGRWRRPVARTAATAAAAANEAEVGGQGGDGESQSLLRQGESSSSSSSSSVSAAAAASAAPPPLNPMHAAGLTLCLTWAEGARASDVMLLRVSQLVSDGIDEVVITGTDGVGIGTTATDDDDDDEDDEEDDDDDGVDGDGVRGVTDADSIALVDAGPSNATSDAVNASVYTSDAPPVAYASLRLAAPPPLPPPGATAPAPPRPQLQSAATVASAQQQQLQQQLQLSWAPVVSSGDEINSANGGSGGAGRGDRMRYADNRWVEDGHHADDGQYSGSGDGCAEFG